MSNLNPKQFDGVTVNHPVAGPIRFSRHADGALGIKPHGGSVLRAEYHPDFSSKYGGVKGLEDYTGASPEEFMGHVDQAIAHLTKHGPWQADEDD